MPSALSLELDRLNQHTPAQEADRSRHWPAVMGDSEDDPVVDDGGTELAPTGSSIMVRWRLCKCSQPRSAVSITGRLSTQARL